MIRQDNGMRDKICYKIVTLTDGPSQPFMYSQRLAGQSALLGGYLSKKNASGRAASGLYRHWLK